MNVKLLQNKNLLLLILGMFVSLLGTNMQNFALSLYVLKITGSATKFASILSLSIIPQIVIGPFAGVIVDWFNRKRIIVLLDLLRGIVIGIYAIVYFSKGELSIESIYILVLVLSLASLIFQPAINTVIPSIISKESLMEANSIRSFAHSLGSLLAPLVAGFFFGLYGLAIILVINSISFLLSALSETFICIKALDVEKQKINILRFRDDFIEGIKFIFSKEILTSLILLASVLNFAFSPISSLGITYISKIVLAVSDYQYGILEAFFMASMILAPFLASKITKRIKIEKMIVLNVIIVSAIIFLIAFISSHFFLRYFSTNIVPYIVLIVLVFMIGVIVTLGNIAISTLFQEVVPLELMGRVGAVLSTGGMIAMPLGYMLFGALFDHYSAWIPVGLSAVILFISILIFSKMLLNRDNVEKNCNEVI